MIYLFEALAMPGPDNRLRGVKGDVISLSDQLIQVIL